jgi:acyl-CoA reductase-like NAD-dependent aldehyde dehydrogenase
MPSLTLSQVVNAFIAHPAVRKISFTGSTTVGAKIAEMCGRHIKPCTLELGGKAPFIVLEDADLELAASAALFSFTSNAGQVCMATKCV